MQTTRNNYSNNRKWLVHVRMTLHERISEAAMAGINDIHLEMLADMLDEILRLDNQEGMTTFLDVGHIHIGGFSLCK